MHQKTRTIAAYCTTGFMSVMTVKGELSLTSIEKPSTSFVTIIPTWPQVRNSGQRHLVCSKNTFGNNYFYLPGAYHLEPPSPIKTLGDNLCPYLSIFRPSNSHECIMPSNQNKVIVLCDKQSRTSNRVPLTKYSKNKKIQGKVDSRI